MILLVKGQPLSGKGLMTPYTKLKSDFFQLIFQLPRKSNGGQRKHNSKTSQDFEFSWKSMYATLGINDTV